MPRFFRKIRQRLLPIAIGTDNKFSKYLLYAVGEILLVVIGILIAFQVDNWNEERKIRNTELLILEDIRDEIGANILLLKKVIEEDELSFNASKELFQIMGDRDLFIATADSAFRRLLHRMNTTWTYEAELGTLNSVINSGKLEYIANQQLKIRLTSLDGKIKDAIEGTRYVTELRTPLYFSEQSQNYVYHEIKGWTLEKEKFWSSQFYGWIRMFNGFKRGAISEEKELLQYFHDILNMVDLEIHSK